MRILADENFPRAVVENLRKHDHDVLWARTDCPGMKDHALLERAEAEGRIILTLDKDFWQIAVQRPLPLKRSGVILFRVNPAIPANLEPLMNSILTSARSWVGSISTVTAGGIEMIPARGSQR